MTENVTKLYSKKTLSMNLITDYTETFFFLQRKDAKVKTFILKKIYKKIILTNLSLKKNKKKRDFSIIDAKTKINVLMNVNLFLSKKRILFFQIVIFKLFCILAKFCCATGNCRAVSNFLYFFIPMLIIVKCVCIPIRNHFWLFFVLNCFASFNTLWLFLVLFCIF